jgi:hypothetical protein
MQQMEEATGREAVVGFQVSGRANEREARSRPKGTLVLCLRVGST